MNLLNGAERQHFTFSHWLRNALKRVTKPAAKESDRHTYLFDTLDILIALNYIFQNRDNGRLYQGLPLGAYCNRTNSWLKIIDEIINSLETISNESPFVASGLFGGSVEECRHIVSVFEDRLIKILRTIDPLSIDPLLILRQRANK